jgi:hypothetical protein
VIGSLSMELRLSMGKVILSFKKYQLVSQEKRSIMDSGTRIVCMEKELIITAMDLYFEVSGKIINILAVEFTNFLMVPSMKENGKII